MNRLEPVGTFFLTDAPELPPTRRRDPLGFSNVAAYYADLLAPGITNRVRDARWIPILAWCLRQVQADFPRLESYRDQYARMQGLELRWVIETCRLPDTGLGRQIPGSRAVRKLHKAVGGIASTYALGRRLRSQMGDAQWNRYRYVGPFSAYRGIMQQLDLIGDDGWQLTAAGLALAKIAERQSAIELYKAAVITNKRPNDQDTGWVSYWLRRWPPSDSPPNARSFLPTKEPFLSASEINRLCPALFSPGSRRYVVAKSIQRISDDTHAGFCAALERKLLALRCWSAAERQRLEKFGHFACLADSAIDALRVAYAAVANAPQGNATPRDVARSMEAELDALRFACDAWTTDQVWPAVDDFVQRLRSVRSDAKTLIALVVFHQEHGSGLNWLRHTNGLLDKAARHEAPPSGYYRFRLEALARLAAACRLLPSLPSCFAFGTREGMEDDDE